MSWWFYFSSSYCYYYSTLQLPRKADTNNITNHVCMPLFNLQDRLMICEDDGVILKHYIENKQSLQRSSRKISHPGGNSFFLFKFFFKLKYVCPVTMFRPSLGLFQVRQTQKEKQSLLALQTGWREVFPLLVVRVRMSAFYPPSVLLFSVSFILPQLQNNLIY